VRDCVNRYQKKLKDTKDDRYYARLEYFKNYYRNLKSNKKELEEELREALEKLKKYENSK